MTGSACVIRSPSSTSLSRSTPCVDGCCGPMLSTMSVLSAAPPIPTMVSDVGVMDTVSPTYACGMETGIAGRGGEPVWRGLPLGLLRMRRLLLVVWLGLSALVMGLLLGLLAGPVWALCALLPLAALGWGWVLLGRNWRS